MESQGLEVDSLKDALLILESGEVYRNPTEVKMSQIVLPCHANHCEELSVGQLLKWMDSTACLSGKLVSFTAELAVHLEFIRQMHHLHIWHYLQTSTCSTMQCLVCVIVPLTSDGWMDVFT